MYTILEHYLPKLMDKEESDISSILEKDWAQLVAYVELSAISSMARPNSRRAYRRQQQPHC
jgi:hypothetical protein